MNTESNQPTPIDSGFDTPRELFRCKVAGIPYRNHPPGLVASIKVGDLVTLVVEPTNRFDPNAIKVMHGTTHLGYIPKIETHRVQGFTTMRVAHVDPAAKWNEVHIEEVDGVPLQDGSTFKAENHMQSPLDPNS